MRAGGALRGLRGGKFDIERDLIAVHDMCKAGHRVIFEIDDNGKDLSHAEHRKTGERVNFVPNGRCWDIEAEVVPYKEVQTALRSAKRFASLQQSP